MDKGLEKGDLLLDGYVMASDLCAGQVTVHAEFVLKLWILLGKDRFSRGEASLDEAD